MKKSGLDAFLISGCENAAFSSQATVKLVADAATEQSPQGATQHEPHRTTDQLTPPGHRVYSVKYVYEQEL